MSVINLEAPEADADVPWRSVQSVTLHLSPARVVRALGAILLLLLLAHATALVLTFGLGHDYAYGFVPRFNFGLEANVPTFFASALFVLNSLLFALLAGVGGRRTGDEYKTWTLLAVVFGFLGIDELARIHEVLIRPMRSVMDASGYLYFAWVIPYMILVLALGIRVAPVLWRLGRRFRLLFGASAVAYVGGAVGIEMLGGAYFETVGTTADLGYRLFQTVEETLEFCGLIILVYTLLELLRSRATGVDIALAFENAQGCTVSRPRP